MDARSENTLSMFFTTDVKLKDNAALFANIPALANAVARFRGLLTNLKGLVVAQRVSTKGATADKRSALIEMVEAAVAVAGAVAAYASETNNGVLLQKVEVSDSGLRRTRDTEVSAVCQGIHDVATANLAHLADYGVDADVLTDLQGKVGMYDGNISLPTSTKGDKKAAGQALKVTLATTRKVLEGSIDKQMLRFRLSQPDFYNQYRAARVIIDSPGGHKSKNGNGNGNGHTPPQP